jgi:phosphoribosylformylglycinamidine (FGAM) synthase-like enzyme
MRPDHLKTGAVVHADRSGIGGIADDSDHLPVAAGLALPNQALQQLQADALAVDRRLQVDRILHREAVGRPRPVGAGIGVADHLALAHTDEIGIAAIHQRAIAARHLGEIRRDQLERRGAVADGMFVDGGDGGKVGLGVGLMSSAGMADSIFARRKRKAPAVRPGLRSCRSACA